jgi:hypothetical protein
MFSKNLCSKAFLLRKEVIKMEESKLPEYETPKVVTYTDEEMFEKLGPAHTGTITCDHALG